MPTTQTQQTQDNHTQEIKVAPGSQPPEPAGQVVWIDKAAVAKCLGISERTANELHTKIKSEKRRSPTSNQVVWMFHAGDVARYAFERDNPGTGRNGQTGNLPVPSQLGQGGQGLLPAQPAVDYNQLSDAGVVAAFKAGIYTSSIEAPPAPRPWLTLDEATEFSGLPKEWLRELAEQMPERAEISPLAIRDVGERRRGGRWRFHRESLEKA